MNFLGLLGVILTLAKVFGYTTLSWAAVTAPFWIPLAIWLALVLLYGAVALFGFLAVVLASK